MKKKNKNTIKRTITFLIILGILTTLVFALRIVRIQVNSAAEPHQVIPSNFQTISTQDVFTEVKSSTKKVAILFTSNWCGSCENIKEQLKSLATEFSDLAVYIADIESYRTFANSYNVAITPALVLIENKAFNTIQEIRPESVDNMVREFALLGI